MVSSPEKTVRTLPLQLQRTCRSQAFKAAFQPYCKSELLVEVRRARVNRSGFRLVILVRLETTRKHGFIVQPACLVYEFVHLVSTFVSPNVRPASTDFGIAGCFKWRSFSVTSRSSRVFSARVIVIGRARVKGRAIVPVSE
jgi:hypothetical protein